MNDMSRRALFGAALLSAGATASRILAPMTAPAQPQTMMRGGCLRFYAGGPQWHTNDTHRLVGIRPESLHITTGGDLSFTLTPNAPVISAFATPDETLVSRGIDAGISGGVSECIVRFAKNGKRLYLNRSGDYAHLVGDLANLWVTITSVANR